MPSNELYMVVLPLMHINTGQTEQTLTLFPDRNLATEFFQDEVQGYINFFKSRIEHLTGGHVKGYDFHPEDTEDVV